MHEISYNPFIDIKQSYGVDDMNLKNLGLSILDKNSDLIENDKTLSNVNNMHQVWNIQITELKEYCKLIEQDCHSVNQRLQDQNTINQELEHKNVLLESKYQGKANEVEILKKWLKENTEISKELKSILASTTSTLELTKENNQNLAKKIKKYKKLLKVKNINIQSMSEYDINDSVVDDIKNIFGFNGICDTKQNPFLTNNSSRMSTNKHLSMNRVLSSYLEIPHNDKKMKSCTRAYDDSYNKMQNCMGSQALQVDNELQKYDTVYLTDRNSRPPIREEIKSDK